MDESEGIDQSGRNTLFKWYLRDEVTLSAINVSENRTCQIVDSQGFRSILKLHRRGYLTRQAIENELAWMRTHTDVDVVHLLCADFVCNTLARGEAC